MAFEMIEVEDIYILDEKARKNLKNIIKKQDPKRLILKVFDLLKEMKDKSFRTSNFIDMYSFEENLVLQVLAKYDYRKKMDVVKVIFDYKNGNKRSLQNFKKRCMEVIGEAITNFNNIDLILVDDSIKESIEKLEKKFNFWGYSYDTLQEYDNIKDDVLSFIKENDMEDGSKEDIESVLLMNGFEKEVDFINFINNELIEYYNNLIKRAW